ncbi:MAG: hypothetical protein GF375_03285, partial [Candidatus Omnitrophica bacterium]|nr:hypothetical protein [Candidatus Omnitrophota bacterium]
SEENTIVLCGDAPLITRKTLRSFIKFFLRKNTSCSFITANMKRNNKMGVVLRDDRGNPEAICEQIDSRRAPAKHRHKLKNGCEVNSGVYCFKTRVLPEHLSKIKKNNRKREYFLTDIIRILHKEGDFARSYYLENADEITGINTPQDLFFCERVMRMRILAEFYRKGVRIIDPETTFIQKGVKIGNNTVIYPFTFIEKGVIIGNNCLLGPFLHIRGGTRVGDGTHLGNFSEINRTKIGSGVRIKHFGYLGDTHIYDNVNIGAGAVTANFDGKRKHQTSIGKGAFIGSDSILVAPVRIGPGAVTGAGSVVNRDVKKQSTVVGVPARQIKRKGDCHG